MRIKLLESDIQRTCEDLLQLDGWRVFRLEQNYSETKRKCIGERGAADALLVRYGRGGTPQARKVDAEVLIIEWKRPGGVISPYQRDWHRDERARGAETWIAGEDFEPSIDGFMAHYRGSGLNRGKV